MGALPLQPHIPELEIVHLGHPALRARSTHVTKAQLRSPEFQALIDGMIRLCLAHNGVGIAAAQVGINKRVIVIHVDPTNPRYLGHAPLPVTVIVNPKIIEASTVMLEGWEGDLSANLRAVVSRPATCTVQGTDRYGAAVVHTITDSFHARVFQHEVDHLNGIMLIDRVKRRETICELPEFEKYWKHKPL